MYPGIKAKLGDVEYTIPALSLGQLRNGLLVKIKEADDLVTANKFFEAMCVRGEVILEALHRNYPDVSLDTLMAYLDLNNTNDLWLAVLGASGLKLGERVGAEAGISAPSTGSLPQLMAGPTNK